METFPYRFVATDGMYAGTTFVYLADGTVISYPAADPDHYFITKRIEHSRDFWSKRREMTAEKLAEFEAVPVKKDDRQDAEGDEVNA